MQAKPPKRKAVECWYTQLAVWFKSGMRGKEGELFINMHMGNVKAA